MPASSLRRNGKREWENGINNRKVRLVWFGLNTLCQYFAAKLPKWFGVRPGKKSGEPETPEEDDEAKTDDPDEDIDEIGNVEDVEEVLEDEEDEYEDEEEEEEEE